MYSGFDIRPPNDVLKMVGYKCKRCGARLSLDKFYVKVKKADGTFS